jgi:prephenate dehydratase
VTAPDTGAAPLVAFQGEAGAFSEEALLAHFRAGAEPLPCRDFEGVGEAVRSGTAAYGVIPVENSLAGSVQAAYDVLAGGGLTIVGEIVIPIRHFLLGSPGSHLGEIRRVTSHPVALAQCARFLSGRPELEVVAVYDTAGAAREVARRGDPGVAAVAARAAAERYGLQVLAENIQDRDDNQTRFYVIRTGEQPSVAHDEGTGPHKSVLLLELEDLPGTLLRVLEPFAARGINLSKLESRPGGVPWRYRFILELRAHLASPDAAAAVEDARRRSSSLSVLGSFPAGG